MLILIGLNIKGMIQLFRGEMAETVFISGANRGIGFALVERFLKGNFHVFAGSRKPSSDLSSILKKFSNSLTIVQLDVTDMNSIRQTVKKVTEIVPALDILINNAAVNLDKKGIVLEKLDLGDMHLEKTMNVNVYGPLRMTQQFLPLLEKGKRKLIINISSEAGSIADCWRKVAFAYCMSKTALNMQSKILQNYLGPRGFKILAVHPGWVRTDMGGPNAAISPDESVEGIFKLAIRRWTPEDVIYLDYKGNTMRW
jgi:NAD(P)-dependent dehydrogenase (short-subunit alcohol dehydrogenase family)